MTTTRLASIPNDGNQSVSPSSGKAVTAGLLGNVLEWYDFAVYAFLVPVIAPLFFADADPTAAVLLSLAVLGSGFVMRPVGALVFGIYGDKRGRRAALSAVMILMGIATVAIGLLPTYATIGLVAPILLTLLRLVQGLASGGEWGGSASFVIEFAGPRQRGFFGSLHLAGVSGGILLGAVTVAVINLMVSPEALTDWAWRIPFLFGGLVALIGLILRLRLSDTPAFLAAKAAVAETPQADRLSTVTRRNTGRIVLAFCLTIFQAIASWVLLTWVVTYLSTVLKMSYGTALLINMVGLAALTLAVPFIGKLSDRVGRKGIMISGVSLSFFGIIPAFLGMESGTFVLVLISYVVIVLLFGLYVGPLSAALAELFPTSMRVTGLSLGYNLAQTIFGGFAPFIASFLVAITGNTIAPAFYVMAGALVSFIALLTVKETAFTELR